MEGLTAEVREVVSVQLRRELGQPPTVHEWDASLLEYFELDSLQLVNMLCVVEDHFGVALLEHVADLPATCSLNDVVGWVVAIAQ